MKAATDIAQIFPEVLYRRSGDYSQVSRVGRVENGWSEVNLCDYWDGLQGIIGEAAELYSRGHLPPLRRMSVFVTDLCNSRCRDCRVDFDSSQSIDLGWLAEQLSEVRRMGAIFLDVIGLGEPTLLRDLPELLKRASEIGLICTIGTNGTTPNLRKPDYLARLLEACPLKIRVSLDSAEARYHDQLRGKAPSWEKAVRFIQRVVEARDRDNLQVSLFINSVVRASNLDQVRRNLTSYAELGADDVHLIPVRYIRDEFCTKQQIQEYNAEIAPEVENLARQLRMAWAANNAYIFGQSELEVELAAQGRYYIPMRARDCYALKSQLLMDACRRPFTCLWGKRAKGRPLFEEPVQEIKDLRSRAVDITYPDVNPAICENYCTREIIQANDRIEGLIHAQREPDGPL